MRALGVQKSILGHEAGEEVSRIEESSADGHGIPYDFGFVPSTEADDGDPIDALVLMDEPAFPGCVLMCRLIGAIEGEQGDKKDKERNDRIVAIQQGAHSWADIKTIDDLAKQYGPPGNSQDNAAEVVKKGYPIHVGGLPPSAAGRGKARIACERVQRFTTARCEPMVPVWEACYHAVCSEGGNVTQLLPGPNAPQHEPAAAYVSTANEFGGKDQLPSKDAEQRVDVFRSCNATE